ncbi:unnamed protein product, partial [Meganyctiphanes norvegica]
DVCSVSGGRGSPGRSSWGESTTASPGGSPGGLKVPTPTAGIGRIARLLTKDSFRQGDGEPYRRRTHSLESKNSGMAIRKASSIDSLVESGNSNNNNVCGQVNNNNNNNNNNDSSSIKSNGHTQAYLPSTPVASKKTRKSQ